MAKLEYYPDQDVLYLHYGEGKEVSSRSLAPHITAEFGTSGALLGIEILSATTVVRALVQPLLDAPDPDATCVASAQKHADAP